MMLDYPLGETLDFKFTTRQFSSGAPFLLVSGAVVVYEDNSTAEITAGETLTPNFDGKAGLNNLRIVATGGNGYESGKSYAAVLSAGTVDSVSVIGEVVAQFTIERSSALRPTTVGRTLDIATTGEVALDFGSTIGTLDAGQFGADFITSAKIANDAFLAVNFAAGSLDGKGDWNINKTGYALTTADWNVGKTGYSLSAAGVDLIFDELLAGHAISDSVGEILNDLQDGGRLDLLIDAIKVKTDELTFTKANQIDANGLSQVGVTITGDGSGTKFGV